MLLSFLSLYGMSCFRLFAVGVFLKIKNNITYGTKRA